MTYRKRKADSDSVNLGSNPSSPATKKTKRTSGFRASKAPRKTRNGENRQRTRAARKSAQRIVAWGGFSDGKLDTWSWSIDASEQLAVWTRRRDARRRYEDVRRVVVILPAASRSAGRAR